MGPDASRANTAATSSSRSASSTSLKWGLNGELSPVDLQRVLERLTDPNLTECALDQSQPPHS